MTSTNESNKCCEKCFVKGLYGEPTCAIWNCPCHTNIKEGWQERVLAIANEFAQDGAILPLKLAIESELSKAIEEERSRILAEVRKACHDSYHEHLFLNEIRHIINNSTL